jgi:hypothetical protein
VANSQQNTPINGLLDLGSGAAQFNSASDDSRPNSIDPSSMNSVSHLKKTFTFNSGQSTNLYFDPMWNYGLCLANGPHNQYPMPTFILDDGTTQTALISQSDFAVKQSQDYKIIFDLSGISCSDQGFDAEFRLIKEN